ncbi:hypothetical protein MSLAZ_1358 [Methanosarcina lacustris Z-7289]|uniref:DNA helicase n=1 Tax=Methanosarcina lacustris Z-7289 TaxID=1434111 RepID=A0A0E3S1L5_9EURY|nr:AAA domain-containing protein [Methanosarcina lacustris]AKB74619.1 hypothetical protein MSLAZ_1358 [Methanosarcina lacustris Z-7289]
MNVGKKSINSCSYPVLTNEKISQLIDWLESEKARMEKEKQTFVRVYVLELNHKRVRAKNFCYVDFRVRKDSLKYIERKYSPFVIRENKVFKVNYKMGTCVKCESITDFTLVFEEDPELDPAKEYVMETVPPVEIVNRQIMLLKDMLLGQHPVIKSILFGTYQPAPYRDVIETISPELNSFQKEATKKALGTRDFHLIMGPPGTGKTTIISDLCEKFAANGERVLLASWMNVAIDNALQAVLKRKKVDENRICRIGAGDFKVADEILPLTLTGRLIRSEMLRKKVVGSTLASAYKAVQEPDDLFDVVIVDEAGAATLPQTLLALVLGKKFILIGDHRQLPPVVADENCAEWIRESLFEKLWKMYPEMHSMLQEQYRMDPAIADIVSRTVYHDLGGIKTPESVGKRPCPFEEAKTTGFKNPFARRVVNKTPICWADSSGTMQWINFDSSHSAKNDREIENIGKLLELLVEYSGIDPKTIGVLSPFRYQVSTMVKALEIFIEKGVAVNTIHSFQGNEKDIIIISMVARHTKDSKIFEDIRLLNVAITRAKFKLIIVSDTSISEGKDKASIIMGMLYDSARKNGGYVAKDGLNPELNEEIRKDTHKERTIADAQQYITKERKKLGFYGKL